jgi:signal transduction histidine kinase
MAPELESLIAMVDRSAGEILRDLDPASPARAKAQAIAESSERAVSLLKQLVSVSRRQARPAAAIDLNDVVHRVEPTLARLTGDEVELTIALGQTATLTLGESDFEQILTALVFSARESLTMGGSILLSTSAYDPDQNPAEAPSSTVTLSATAFGYGVQAAKASPALEQAVRRCGGQISVGGEPDRDAIVQVALPLKA